MSDYIGPPRVKTAALGAIAGAVTAHKERKKLREMGLSEEQIDNALTRTGAFARGLGSDLVGGVLGSAAGFGGAILAQETGLIGGNEGLPIIFGGTGLGLGASALNRVAEERERAQQAANTAEIEKLRNLLSST